MITINLNKYTKYWEMNNYSFFWHDLSVYTVYKNNLIKSILGFQEKNLLCIFKKGNYTFRLKNNEVKRQKNKFIDFFCSHSFDKMLENIKMLISESEMIEWEITSNNFKQKFEILCNMHTKASAFYACTESYYVDNVYDYLLDLGFKKEDILRYSMPVIMPTIMNEQKEWYKICIKLKGKMDMKLIIDHHEKWKYIFAKSTMKPYTIRKLLQRFKKDCQNYETIKKAYYHIKNIFLLGTIKKNNSEAQKLFGNNYYPLIKKLCDLAYFRLELRHVWMKTGYLLNTLLIKNFPRKNIFNYSVEEIKNEEYGTENDRKNFTYYAVNKRHFLYYNNTENILDIKKEDSLQEIKEIRGKISFGDNVDGYAFVLEDNRDVIDNAKFVRKDTILILSQLCPEHMSIISICKGIVVDEGGIVGHARIIAMEMGKTAILGTINGTKRIKNNDYIYLDIKSNTVRKILNV
jgi:phosphohistidine swiveling domain-containing protein